jgi:hypothetical protein
MTHRVLLAASAALVASIQFGCSSDSGSKGANDAGAPPPATFTSVVAQVITEKHCGGILCHDTSSIAGFSLGPKDKLYGEFVGQPAGGPKCGPSAPDGGAAHDGGGATRMRVVAGDPDHSLLYLKLSYAPPCGDPMPPTGKLSDADIKLVHDWIAAGAKND